MRKAPETYSSVHRRLFVVEAKSDSLDGSRCYRHGLPAGRAAWFDQMMLAAVVERSRQSGKFGYRVCDAPYQETPTQIGIILRVIMGVSVWLRNMAKAGAGGQAARRGRRGTRRCNLNGHAIS